MIVGVFTKSLLFLMLISLFWAGFQVFLRFEKPMPPEVKKSIVLQQQVGESSRFKKIADETLLEFFKRFQKSAFFAWENSFPAPKSNKLPLTDPK